MHGRSSARGPSDRTLIPFKGEARRRYAAAYPVGERGGRERGERRRREKEKGRRLDRVASEGRGSTRNRVVRGRDRGARGKKGTEGLKEAHCLPSEADNSVMNVTNARPRSGL